MSEQPKRTYKSDLRAAQADATRRSILAAAGRVCRSAGWPSATISAIAEEAGVSRETVKAIFGNKASLIGEMVKANVAEARLGEHFLDDERPRAIRAETNQARQVDLWATYLAEILERVAPLMAVVHSGAESEPEMEELYHALHRGRRANLTLIAKSIRTRGALHRRLSVEQTTDILWELASPEMFSLQTKVAGRTTEGYATWLSDMLKVTLLKV